MIDADIRQHDVCIAFATSKMFLLNFISPVRVKKDCLYDQFIL